MTDYIGICGRRNLSSAADLCITANSAVDVRFGSKADIALGRACVRFTPKSGHAERQLDVRFVPKAEVGQLHSMTLSARVSKVAGTSMPSDLAVCRLMTNSNLVDCTTGKSAGLAPLRILPA